MHTKTYLSQARMQGVTEGGSGAFTALPGREKKRGRYVTLEVAAFRWLRANGVEVSSGQEASCAVKELEPEQEDLQLTPLPPPSPETSQLGAQQRSADASHEDSSFHGLWVTRYMRLSNKYCAS